MKIKAIYEKHEDIPDGFQELYTERDSKWELTGVEGMRPSTEVTKVQETLKREREEHKTKNGELAKKLKTWEDLGDYDEIVTKLDSIPELEAKATTGKIPEDKINEMVELRVKREKAPLERDLKNAQEALAARDTEITNLKANDVRRTIHDVVRSAALESKVHATALDDILSLAERVMEVDEHGKVFTKDSVGMTPNIDPKVWLMEMQERRPHWWPASNGGGAMGSGSGGPGHPNNPWSPKHWNVTEQARAMMLDRKKAEQMAAAAGSYIGATEPTVVPK